MINCTASMLLFIKTPRCLPNSKPKRISSFFNFRGTEFQLLPQNPHFITKSQMFEPLYVPDEEILENSLRREIEKFCFADTLLNRIVYDSVDPSPFTKDVDPKSYGLDVMPYYLP